MAETFKLFQSRVCVLPFSCRFAFFLKKSTFRLSDRTLKITFQSWRVFLRHSVTVFYTRDVHGSGLCMGLVGLSPVVKFSKMSIILGPTVSVTDIIVIRPRLSANKVEAIVLVRWGCEMGWRKLDVDAIFTFTQITPHNLYSPWCLCLCCILCTQGGVHFFTYLRSDSCSRHHHRSRHARLVRPLRSSSERTHQLRRPGKD